MNKRKTLKATEYPEMEFKLFKWFTEQRKRNISISEELLVQKAKIFFSNLYPNQQFNASRGWISKFRKRYGVRNLKICGEKLSSNENAVQPFRLEFSSIVEGMGILPCQIYNADESGLYWKGLPDKTLVGPEEKTAPGRKMNKERVTFLVCCNATGTHRLKLLVLGKSKKPRSFGSMKLPVEYTSTRSAWMTSFTFKNWFTNSFVPDVKAFMRSQGLPEKALLLLDNAPCHQLDDVCTDDGMIRVLFFPPNCTPLIQPMDQNVIRIIKLNYKKSLLLYIMEKININEALKQVTLKEAVFFLANAWSSTKTEMIQSCWNSLLSSNNEWCVEDNIPLAQPFPTHCGMNEIRNLMENVRSSNEIQLTNEEIRNWVDENHIEENVFEEISDEEEIQCEKPNKNVKHEDGIRALTTAIDWAIENEVSTADIMTLFRLKDKAALALNKRKKKQTLITEFLHKSNN